MKKILFSIFLLTSFNLLSNEVSKEQIDKESYALGINIVSGIQKNLYNIEKQGVKLNYDKILEAINKGLNNKNEMTSEEARVLILSLMERISKNKKELKLKENKNNKNMGINFLKENKNNENIIELESGLQYEIIKLGYGKKPKPSDKVKVHYKGTLITGEEFDSSYKRNKAIEFNLSSVIKGWTEGLQIMPEGSKFKFYIPSNLAYGDRETGIIKPHSVLIFEVELLKIIK